MRFQISANLTRTLAKRRFHFIKSSYFLYRFDWQEKLLEKNIKTELQMQEYIRNMNEAMSNIAGKSFAETDLFTCV